MQTNLFVNLFQWHMKKKGDTMSLHNNSLNLMTTEEYIYKAQWNAFSDKYVQNKQYLKYHSKHGVFKWQDDD